MNQFQSQPQMATNLNSKFNAFKHIQHSSSYDSSFQLRLCIMECQIHKQIHRWKCNFAVEPPFKGSNQNHFHSPVRGVCRTVGNVRMRSIVDTSFSNDEIPFSFAFKLSCWYICYTFVSSL